MSPTPSLLTSHLYFEACITSLQPELPFPSYHHAQVMPASCRRQGKLDGSDVSVPCPDAHTEDYSRAFPAHLG